MTQEDLINGLEADGVVRDTGAGNNNSRNDNPAGNSGDGAPADDVSQAELVRQFGDEFRRSMQAAIDRNAFLAIAERYGITAAGACARALHQ